MVAWPISWLLRVRVSAVCAGLGRDRSEGQAMVSPSQPGVSFETVTRAFSTGITQSEPGEPAATRSPSLNP